MQPESVDDVVESVFELSLDDSSKLACKVRNVLRRAACRHARLCMRAQTRLHLQEAEVAQPEQDIHDAEDDGQHLCPICLDSPELAEVAALHGCGHTYCGADRP